MERNQIISWRDRYNQEEDLSFNGVEERIGKKIRMDGFLTKEDLETIIKWKFNGRLAGRQKHTLNLLRNVDGNQIKETTLLAFKITDDRSRIKLLSTIRGVGNALSSVILSFYDPQNYGILDIHSWRCLFGPEPADIFTNPERVITFFTRLREISRETGLSCRDIEKAMFKKDLDSGRNTRLQ